MPCSNQQKKYIGHILWRWVRKNKVTIDNLSYLYLKQDIDSALIIAPKSVYTIGERNKTHMPDEVQKNI